LPIINACKYQTCQLDYVACLVVVYVHVESQAHVRQTFGIAPSSHQATRPCQTPKNPGLEMKQRRMCHGVYMYVLCMCVAMHLWLSFIPYRHFQLVLEYLRSLTTAGVGS